ncbi:FecR domain-containing protein [Candidatus Woesearchaeota archaeon]|nr:FecR domain-containing protein [Candidatus Woesearchaeota archaeon]
MGWIKKGILIAAVVVVLIVAGIGLYVKDLISGPDAAVLMQAAGVVELNRGGTWTPASAGTSLSQGDAIRTQSGQAELVFYGANILRLSDNSEARIIKLDSDDLQVEHPAGNAWHRVVPKLPDSRLERVVKGLAGYSVKLPDAVATVRGTSFATRPGSAGKPTQIHGVTGKVLAAAHGKESLLSGQTASVLPDGLDVGALVQDDWIQQNIMKDAEFDKNLLAELKQKYALIINYVKQNYGVTDEKIDELVLGYLQGSEEITQAASLLEQQLAVVIQDVQGEAEAFINGEWVAVVKGMQLEIGSKVVTGENGSIAVLVGTEKVCLLQGGTLGTVVEKDGKADIDGEPKPAQTSLKQLESFATDPQVSTPRLVCAVRG